MTSKLQGLASGLWERGCCHHKGKDPSPCTFPKMMQSRDHLWSCPWSHSSGSRPAPRSSFHQLFYQPSAWTWPCAVLPWVSAPSHISSTWTRLCPQLSAPSLALQSITDSPLTHHPFYINWYNTKENPSAHMCLAHVFWVGHAYVYIRNCYFVLPFAVSLIWRIKLLCWLNTSVSQPFKI